MLLPRVQLHTKPVPSEIFNLYNREKLLRDEGLRCLICHKRKGWTKSEDQVDHVLKTRFPHLEYFPECRVLESFGGCIDFTVLSHRVLLQVDGPSHTKFLDFPKAEGVQQALVDDKCNQGWHMLRIHENDASDTHGSLVEVLKIAEWCEAGAGT